MKIKDKKNNKQNNKFLYYLLKISFIINLNPYFILIFKIY